MNAIKADSLAATVDCVNEAFFFGRSLPPATRRRVARWIGGRQGQAGGYCGMPAPTERDFVQGLRLFTGETIRSRRGAAHVLGQEACRVLILLDVEDRDVQSALDRANQGMLDRLEMSRREGNMGREWRGEYCCATCTCALWRHLAVGGLRDIGPQQWLDAGLMSLRAHRAGNARWRRFPFFYTLLALSELDSRDAVDECRYAAAACERVVSRAVAGDTVFAQRRRALAERILSKV